MGISSDLARLKSMLLHDAISKKISFDEGYCQKLSATRETTPELWQKALKCPGWSTLGAAKRLCTMLQCVIVNCAHINKPYKNAQNRLLFRDKNCLAYNSS